MRAVPFTVSTDLDLGMRIAPYIVGSGADVTIREGDVPETIPDVVHQGVAYSASASQFLLAIPNVARFLVNGGSEIIFERGAASDREVALFLLGSAWGALCYQRGLLPLHASAVVHRGFVHAFTGPSGAGKSTLSAALADRGRDFFTDDVLIIDPAEIGETTNCYTGQKDLKLWKDALSLTGAEKTSPVRDAADFKKFFAVPANAAGPSHGILASLSILRSNIARSDGQKVAIDAISGAEALKQLRDSVYRPAFANAIWGRKKLFEALGKLIANVQVQHFDRPMLKTEFDQGVAGMDDWISRWSPAVHTGEKSAA